MGLLNALIGRFRAKNQPSSDMVDVPVPESAAFEQNAGTSEAGRRSTPENQTRAIYRQLSIDYDLRAAILDIRNMDRQDGRVKRIHNRVARDVTRGGLVLQQAEPDKRIQAEWTRFVLRLQLDRAEKLKSDARGLLIEGNLPMQWVLDDKRTVVSSVRMPAETMRPNVGINGRFNDVRAAYTQMDLLNGTELATFPLWQLTMLRLDPDNFDDMSSLGRPFLDASREIWRKLRMTDTDLVIRRRHRAPLRLSHVLENATSAEMDQYQDRVEANKDMVQTDFYLNKKGSVTAIQGDATLGDIQDVVYLLDCFFAGTPLPKGLMGYTDGLARDILDDLKRDYYDEVDQLQDTLAWVYWFGFRLHLLLQGINPDDKPFNITFAERRTETPSQTVDRALKLQALGIPRSMVYEEVGYNANEVEERRASDNKLYDPYPDPSNVGAPTVKITPGNGRKGESGTSIGNGHVH